MIVDENRHGTGFVSYLSVTTVSFLRNMILEKHKDQAWRISMRNKAGFSMLELMIVIGIIAILSAITVPNIIGWYRHQGLRSAVVELQSNLQLVKLAAVKQNQSCSVNIDTGVGSYVIPCLNKTVSLGSYSGGVVFGGPNGEATDNIVTYKSSGTSNSAAPLSVYLTNRDSTGFYRVRVFLPGGVVTSKWDGANWK